MYPAKSWYVDWARQTICHKIYEAYMLDYYEFSFVRANLAVACLMSGKFSSVKMLIFTLEKQALMCCLPVR